MINTMPKAEHVYQNFLMDSTRWNHIQERPGDIIIATPYKCGTTWMQNIVLHLIFQDLSQKEISAISPWVDCKYGPISDTVEKLEAQDHRRCLKSHLPRDGLDLRAGSKYIVVGRDPRDVFMSLWNHYSSYTPDFFEHLNTMADRVGPPLEPCPDDIRELWNMWTNKGWFDWETEGYPHWSNFRHVQTWWDYRHLPNMIFVHFNDLLNNLEAEIARIASFLDIECADDVRHAIAELTTFKSMKRDAEVLDPGAGVVFEGGAQTFYNKGTNGRWRGVLNAGDLKMYDAAVKRELTPDCHTWLENGRFDETLKGAL